MGRFLESEKQRQAHLKLNSTLFSTTAQGQGIYRNKIHPFCIPKAVAEENLYSDIRQPSIDYFSRHQINWHDGTVKQPSNHLCSSQVCCINFLFPFANRPDALKALLLPFYPEIDEMLIIEGDDQFVGFEWIGAENYLHEKVRGKRTRGANATSADAIVMFQRTDRTKQIVLIEWKYTESYSKSSYAISKNGTSRVDIYQPFYDRDDFPLDKSKVVDFEMLFYEPFYQLLRQQLLAHEMELAHEMGADRVTTLHIAPQANRDFQKITSDRLIPYGHNVTNVWHELLKDKSDFRSISTEQLFTQQTSQDFPELSKWWDYISTRYGWQNDKYKT